MQVGGAHWLADRPPVAAPEYADGDPVEVDAHVGVTVQYEAGPGGTLRVQYNIDASQALPAKLPAGLFRCIYPPPLHIIPFPGVFWECLAEFKEWVEE